MDDLGTLPLPTPQLSQLDLDGLPTSELTERLQDILQNMPAYLLGGEKDGGIIKEHVEILKNRLKVVDIGDLLDYLVSIGIPSAELLISKNPILKITLNGLSIALLLPMDRSLIRHGLKIPLKKAEFESYLNTQLLNVSLAERESNMMKAIAFIIGHAVDPDSVDSACLIARNGTILGYLTVFQTGAGYTGPEFRLYFDGYDEFCKTIRGGTVEELDAYDALLGTRMAALNAKWHAISNTNSDGIEIDLEELRNIEQIRNSYMALGDDLSDEHFKTYKRDLMYPQGYSDLTKERQGVIDDMVNIWTQKKVLLSVRHTDAGKRKFRQYHSYLRSEEVLGKNSIGTDLDEESTPNIFTYQDGSIRWIDLGYGGLHINYLLHEINRIDSAV